MALDKFVIYTLRGKEILSRGKVVEQTINDPLNNKDKSVYVMEFHIDLSNDFEKMLLIKNEDDVETDDTALFYQMRELLIEQSDGDLDAHSDPLCLADKIFVVDFGKLFMDLEEDVYFGYHRIEKEYEKTIDELLDIFPANCWSPLPSLVRDELENDETGTPYQTYKQTVEFNEVGASIIENELYPFKKQMASIISHRKHDFLFKNKPLTNTEMLRFIFALGIKVKFTSGEKERTFIPFDKSQSMARNSRITFIDETLQVDVNRRLLLGMDKVGPFSPSKFYAYKGLYLSSGQRIANNTLELNEETVIVIHNGPIIHNKDIKYITNTTDSTNIEIKNGCGIDIDTMFDGEGIISMDYAHLLNEAILKNSSSTDITSFQIRMPFIKGMVHSIDIQGFLDEFYGKEQTEIYIKDCFGIKRDLRKAKIILTQSMYKTFIKGGYDWFTYNDNYLYYLGIDSSDPMKVYFDGFKEYNHALYISGTNLPYKNRSLTTINYQFLNTLDLTDEDLPTLIDEHLKYSNNPIDYLKRVANIVATDDADSDCSTASYTSKESIATDNENYCVVSEDNDSGSDATIPTTNSTSHISTGHIPNWQVALFENNDFIHNSYVKTKVNAIRDSLRKDIAYGRLLVDGEVRYLSRDILCFLKYILDLAYEQNKKENDIEEIHNDANTQNGNTKYDDLAKEVENLVDSFYLPSKNIDLIENQHYPLFRSPHLSRNEQCVLKALLPDKDKSLRHKYLGHLDGVLMVAYNSLVPDALGGADFDGDIVKIFDSDILRNAVLRGVYDMKKDDKYDAKVDYKRELPIIRISAFPSSIDEYYDAATFNYSTYYNVIFHTFSNSVGMISNLAIKLGKKQYGNQTDNDKLAKDATNKYGCEHCTILTGLEIDACKTGIHPELSAIFSAANKNHNPYIMNFLPSLKKLHYISWENFYKVSDEKYEYKDKYNNTFAVDRNSTDILQLLAFNFMETATDFKNAPQRKNKTEISYLFNFEKDSKWKPDNNEDINKLKNLCYAYKYATRIVREYNKQYLLGNSSKWKRYIYTIWTRQDENNKQSSLEYGRIYHNILMHMNVAILKISDKNYTQFLEDFINADWPYLYEEEDKKKFLSTLLKTPVNKLDKELVNRLCNFNSHGYNLLYLFIREAINSVNFINLKDAAEKQIETGDFLFDDKKTLENDDVKCLIKGMIKKIIKSDEDPRKCIWKYFTNKLFYKFIYENPDDQKEEYLFRLMYYISKSDSSLSNFFWDYYSTEEIVDRIYHAKEDNNA